MIPSCFPPVVAAALACVFVFVRAGLWRVAIHNDTLVRGSYEASSYSLDLRN